MSVHDFIDAADAYGPVGQSRFAGRCVVCQKAKGEHGVLRMNATPQPLTREDVRDSVQEALAKVSLAESSLDGFFDTLRDSLQRRIGNQ